MNARNLRNTIQKNIISFSVHYDLLKICKDFSADELERAIHEIPPLLQPLPIYPKSFWLPSLPQGWNIIDHVLIIKRRHSDSGSEGYTVLEQVKLLNLLFERGYKYHSLEMLQKIQMTHVRLPVDFDPLLIKIYNRLLIEREPFPDHSFKFWETYDNAIRIEIFFNRVCINLLNPKNKHFDDFLNLANAWFDSLHTEKKVLRVHKEIQKKIDLYPSYGISSFKTDITKMAKQRVLALELIHRKASQEEKVTGFLNTHRFFGLFNTRSFNIHTMVSNNSFIAAQQALKEEQIKFETQLQKKLTAKTHGGEVRLSLSRN